MCDYQFYQCLKSLLINTILYIINTFLEMNHIRIGHIFIFCFLYGLSTVLTSCENKNNQTCQQHCGKQTCKCNTTEDSQYDNCNQKCNPPYCFEEIPNMNCIAEQNCTQVCQSGNCDMSCNAKGYCKQKSDENGAKKMSCSSKGCWQSCSKGACKTMYCEANECMQTCDKGDCTMNCTESVKTCSQRCKAIDTKCTMECHAEVCLQECSGPNACIIVNAASSKLHQSVSLFVIGLFTLILQ